MAAWKLVRDALLVAAAVYVLVGAVNLTVQYLTWVPTGWDVLLPDRTAIMLLYLMGFGLLAVVWLSHRQRSAFSPDSAHTG